MPAIWASDVPAPTGVEYDLALAFDDLAWIAGHGVAVTVEGVPRRLTHVGASSTARTR